MRCPNCRSTAVQERPDPSSTLAPCQPQQAEKDAADRAAIIAALERQLKRGDKALVGYRRFIKIVDDGHFAIDRNKADEDVRFDGVFVLRTSQPAARDASLQAALDPRTDPDSKASADQIFQKLDEAIRGQVSA